MLTVSLVDGDYEIFIHFSEYRKITIYGQQHSQCVGIAAKRTHNHEDQPPERKSNKNAPVSQHIAFAYIVVCMDRFNCTTAVGEALS